MSSEPTKSDQNHPIEAESPNPSAHSVSNSASGNRPPQESLIAQVLEATLTGRDTSLTDTEWEALSQVARAYPPHTPLQLALVCQLVSTLLKTRFESLAMEQSMFHQMSLRIAGSLWTHPQSQKHLIRFWELLSSEVRK